MTKIEAARQEYKDWCSAIGIETLEAVNQTLEEGRAIELINLCEARQERKYAGIANQIYYRRRTSRIVMMSGPSSSGKTSSSLRIAQQCRVLGLTPKVIELDNYFVSRDRTPRDENGEYDFESLYAMVSASLWMVRFPEKSAMAIFISEMESVALASVKSSSAKTMFRAP